MGKNRFFPLKTPIFYERKINLVFYYYYYYYLKIGVRFLFEKNADLIFLLKTDQIFNWKNADLFFFFFKIKNRVYFCKQNTDQIL